MAINTDSVETMDTDLLGDLALHYEAVIDQLDGDADAERIAELQSAVHVMDAELESRAASNCEKCPRAARTAGGRHQEVDPDARR